MAARKQTGKVTVATRVTAAKKVEPKLDKYMCTRCGKMFKLQKGNFPASQSLLFRENNGYLPICNHCLDELYQHYKDKLGNDKDAIQRMCMKFDIYWSPEVYKMVDKSYTSASRIRGYISRTNLYKFVKKTYDDTLDEGLAPAIGMHHSGVVISDDGETETVMKIAPPTADTVAFWGSGFTPDFYYELNQRYERWTMDMQKPLPIAEEALYKQICIQEANINRNVMSGKNIEQGQNALNNLLGSLNAKPIQQKEEESSSIDDTPLGVWAKRWEENEPIPDDESMNDKESLIKYITVWFFGHLGKMFNLKNVYSRMYEHEIAKYRVERPEYDEEDEESFIDDVFGGDDIDG